MKALIVVESMFGNTRKVAEAVAEGLRGHAEVEVVAAAEAHAPLLELVDLLVVGGPTHAFSMTRGSTREDAVRQGASPEAAVTGIREWIGRLHAGPHSEMVATFDTRVGKVRHLPGSAAKSAVKALRKLGYTPVVPAESFWVADVSGPLLEGELDRARAWGEALATAAARTSPTK
ncbi:MAG TPA: flavodoxin domain-containing protein [Nocardioidaceae bacterium]|nr:flavodoxin domain-containing protein [Nocardioidaceae bacterium]